MVFDNNLDKLYFLKQYIKSFDIRRREEKYPKSIEFTKKK